MTEELAKELTDLLGGTESPIAGVVRIVPIDRLNAVLVISPQQRYIDQLQAWFKRFDRPGEGNDKKIYVYRVQNGRASDIASTLLKTLFRFEFERIDDAAEPGWRCAANPEHDIELRQHERQPERPVRRRAGRAEPAPALREAPAG